MNDRFEAWWPLQRELWESVTAFEDRYVRAHDRPVVKGAAC